MSGAVYARTPNLGLGLIEFDFPNWADDANLNTKIIDAGFSFFGISIKGAWQNNTPYIPGDLVVDVDDNTLWRAAIAHTSAATGPFSADRAAHPLYWVDATQSIHARGQWQPATQYYLNDIVYKDELKQVWAIATQQYVSSGAFDTDVSAGYLAVITDLSIPVNDAQQAAIAAATSATEADASADSAAASAGTAVTAASSASGSAIAASNSASAAAASASASAASATSAATSATEADASEADAEAAAAQALALFNAMMPDAPSDGKQYGRLNGAWSIIKASTTPSDTPPTSPQNGQLWFETDTGNTYVWYDDGTSAQWVQINTIATGVGGFLVGTGAPAGSLGTTDDMYLDKTTGTFYGPKSGSTWPTAVDMGTQAEVDAKVGEAPNDGTQYVRKNLGWTPVSVPPGTATTDTPPAGASNGQLWWESDTGAFYVYYNDGNSSQWVQVNGQAGGNVTGPATATDNAVARYDTATGKLLQDSPVVVNDAGDITTPGNLFVSGQIYQAGATAWVKASQLATNIWSVSVAATITTGVIPGNYPFGLLVADNFSEAHLAATVTPHRADGVMGAVDLPATVTPFVVYGRQTSGTIYVASYYMVGSPPYDMGDGEAAGFIYAEIDKTTGAIRQIWMASDPPWITGPSHIEASDYRNGVGVMRRKRVNGKLILTDDDLRECGLSMREAITTFAKAETEEVEITEALKNTDMDAVPHPFLSTPAIKDGTAYAVLLDPMSQMVADLIALNNNGHGRVAHDLIHNDGTPNEIVIGTDALARGGPRGLNIVSVGWR